jgi:hypothetical protein
MKRFVEGVDRGQSTLFPECLDDWVDEDNPVRVIDVFVDELDLGAKAGTKSATGWVPASPMARCTGSIYGLCCVYSSMLKKTPKLLTSRLPQQHPGGRLGAGI